MPRTDAQLKDLETQVSTGAIRLTCWLVAVIPAVLLALNYGVFNNANQYGASVLYPSLLLSLIGAAGIVLSHRLNTRLLTICVIFTIQVVAAYGIYSFGSIRAAGSMLYLTSVVAAGIFLGRGALVISLLTSFAALGALTYAEITGVIAPITLQVSTMTWFTHAVVLTAVAMLVSYARERTRKAYEQQIRALEENKRLAQERDRNLDHFTRIFRTSPSPMVAQVAATGKIVDVNPAFERHYGHSKLAVLGKSDYMLWAKPEQRVNHLEQLKAHHRAEQVDALGLRADGTHFDAHIRSEMGYENEDSLVITTITDMTEQNDTLRRLRRSEERFSKAFKITPLNLIITRQSDDTVVEINRSERSADTTPRSDALGLRAQQVGPWFSPSGREDFFQRLNTHGHLHGHETTLTRPNGSTIDAKVWAEQIEIDEEPCVLTCIVDSSEEKRREMLLRDLASGMTGHTAQAFFSALTKNMSTALGADMVLIGELSSQHTVQTIAASKNGQPIPNFAFSIEGKLCEKSMRQREPLVLGEGLTDAEKWNGLDDDTLYEACVCQALHDSEGKPIGLLNALWTNPINHSGDMMALMAIFASRANAEMMRLQGDRKIEHLNETLEQRVHERTAELSKLNAELDSFAYSISHDLKSPLRAIDGFTQLLSERLENRLEPEEQHLMDRVLGATHRMATLMADLLALARVSQLSMDRERINLSALAKKVYSELAHEPSHAQVNLQIEPGVYGHGDRALTRTLLEQLIGNAIKFTRGQAHPLIEFGQKRNGSGSAEATRVFFVRDNGAGFSMEHKDKLFKPFQRLHMPSAGFEGTGIGLATVRRIVERHGGSVEGEGEVNRGAEFRFSLGAGVLEITDDSSTPMHEATARKR